jgi:hypothetical protein
MIFGEVYQPCSTSLLSFPTVPSYWFLLKPKYLSQHPTLEHPQPVFFPSGDTPSFTPIKITGNITVLYILMFTVIDHKWENRRFWTKWWEMLPKYREFHNVLWDYKNLL